MHIPYDHINLLKCLPKHGQGGQGVKSTDSGDFLGNRKNQEQELVDLREKNELLKEEDGFIKLLTKSYYDLANAEAAYVKGTDGVKRSSATIQVGLNKLIGITESVGKSLIKAAKASTFLEQRNKELNKAFGINSETAAELGDKYDALGISFGTGGKQIRKYAQSLNSILPLQAKNITNSIKQIKTDQAAQKAAQDATESFFEGTGDGLENAEATTAALENQVVLQQSVGTELFEMQKIMQENLGLSGETANKFALFAATAHDGAAGAKTIAAQLTSGLVGADALGDAVGVTRTILQDVAELSSDVQLQFGNMPDGLGLAVMKARMLGISLDKVFSIGKNLLNIEQSVGNELEYQLLSGKRLVNQAGESLTQKYREATLNGSALDQMNALNEIIESQGDEIKTNFMARKKLADTLGIGEDALSKMVQKRELLQDMGPGAEKILELQGEELSAAVQSFKKTATKDQLDAFDKLIDQQANTMTTDERMLYYLETLTTGVIGEQVRLQGGSSADIVKAAQEGFTNKEGKASFKKSTETFQDQFFGGDAQAMAESLGAMGKLAIASNTAQSNLAKFAEILPVFGGIINKLKEDIDLSSVTGINSIQATTVEDISVGGVGTTAEGAVTGTKQRDAEGNMINSSDAIVKVNDAILFDPNDQLAVVASTSRDGFENGIAAVEGNTTNNNITIDYNKLAMAVAGAMKNVQIVAPTDIYADSKMNLRSIG